MSLTICNLLEDNFLVILSYLNQYDIARLRLVCEFFRKHPKIVEKFNAIRTIFDLKNPAADVIPKNIFAKNDINIEDIYNNAYCISYYTNRYFPKVGCCIRYNFECNRRTIPFPTYVMEWVFREWRKNPEEFKAKYCTKIMIQKIEDHMSKVPNHGIDLINEEYKFFWSQISSKSYYYSIFKKIREVYQNLKKVVKEHGCLPEDLYFILKKGDFYRSFRDPFIIRFE